MKPPSRHRCGGEASEGVSEWYGVIVRVKVSEYSCNGKASAYMYNVCVTCMCMNVHVYERYIQCTVYIHMYVSECVREAEWVGVGCGRRG